MKKFKYSFASPEIIESGIIRAKNAISAGAAVARRYLARGYQEAAKISIEA
jgi:hypothetical protein